MPGCVPYKKYGKQVRQVTEVIVLLAAVLWPAIALGLVGLTVAVWVKFDNARRLQLARISRGSQVMPSPFGQIEFATAGEGGPVLVIHGAGGGFDQVVSAANQLIAAGFQVIAPSRFGYLRSSSPTDPSPQNQAAAYATLLDALKIQNIPVIGISAGALSALHFALRYPERCRSLTVIVPAVSAAGDALRPQGKLPEQGWLSKAIINFTVRSDFLFWLGIVLAPNRMIRSVLATAPRLMAQAGATEQERVHRILCNILPLSKRAQGLLNDARYTSEPQSIALDQISVPTLVISLEDDFYRTIAPARFIAARIPGARLITYASGGHIWLGHDAELFSEVIAFLGKNRGALPGLEPSTVRREA
jgi:pimeloyl-ACP methyl ester carboxylesterase